MKHQISRIVIAAILLLAMLVSCDSVDEVLSDTTEALGSLLESESATESETDAPDTDTDRETASETEAEEIKEPTEDAYYIIEAVAQNGRNGLANGWNYDNRFDLTNSSGLDASTVYDKTDEAFYRLIRDFDAENDGYIKLEMIIEAESSEEGVYIALCDANDVKLFGLTVKGGYWTLVGNETVATTVAVPNGVQTKTYGIEMIIDLDNDTASVTVNNVYGGEVTIPDSPITRLILGTNKQGTGTIGFTYVRMMKNYPIVDRFILGDVADYEGQAPANWTVTGNFVLDRIRSMRLYDMYSVKAESAAGEKSSAYKSFRSIGGKVAFETMILLPTKVDGASVALMSGEKAAVTFETREGKIYVGEHMVNDYIANVWQTLHVEADTEAGKADIYVNGKKRAAVDIDVESFDGVRIGFEPGADAVMWFDDVEIFPVFEYDDYPEEPQVAESKDYNIGMNVCWIWRDQQSGEGWDATSPFAEFDPYLGFYDEGLRETADWELKWMAEHGIDFLHTCWYCPSGDIQAPIKEMRHSYAALHDGYMMAKYSDYVDFCIMWENNGQDCTSFEQFREYIWNYWVEYYFSDERYARLDNRAVLTVWNTNNFIKSFGDEEGARRAVKFMDTELRKLGYDGIIILASTTGKPALSSYERWAKIGFDSTYGYHWNAGGYSEKLQIECNKTNLETSAGILHHIPTVSIGFNDVGRNETRDPIISVDGHLKVCKDIKATLAGMSTGTWKDNTLFISTWNEYSEGTYIFPTESTGFDYLENIRKTFTDDTSDHSAIDVRPTGAQIERVTHLYPDNHSPIRWYQFEKPDTAIPDYKVTVNGALLGFTFNPQLTEDGDLLVVGEAKGKGFYSALRLYHEWDRFTGDGVLTLYTFKGDKLVFTVGSDKVLFNGAERKLGYTFSLRDGLPQFHIKKLCKMIGYKYVEKDGVVIIQAATDEEYEMLSQKVDDQWEFSLENELQGWKIQEGMATVGDDGLLHVVPSGTDIAVIHDVSFNGSKYNVIRIGVKYNPAVVTQRAELFFKTKSSPSYTGDKCITTFYKTEGMKEGDTVEAIFLLESNTAFSGAITGIRIDPCTGTTPFEIDYIRCEFDPEYAIENKIVAVDDDNQWYFDTDDKKEGWTLGNAKFRGVENGVYKGIATNADPAMYKTVNFKARNYQVMIVGMKYNPATATQVSTLYFRTQSDQAWNEAKSVKGGARIPDGIETGDTYQIVFDLTGCEAWAGTITDLRFDPFNMIGEFEVDYIRLYKIPKEVVEGAVAPTKPTEVVITNAESIPEGVEVTSEDKARLVIVEDPTNPNKKVFKVECINQADNSTTYTYLNVKMHFEPGESYKIEYKLMPLTDIGGDPFENTIIGGNLRYSTVSVTSTKDHTFDSGSNKSTSDQWITVSKTFAVAADYSAKDNDCFQLWGKFSPQSGKGISYLVKDISIKLAD